MKNDQLPEGFLAEREGDDVRVHLPEVVVTTSHVLEPVLTRGAAQRLAEALWEADVDAPVARIVLVRDPRLPEPAVAKFRERLVAVLIEGGVDADVAIEVDTAAASPHPEPVAPAAAAPAPVAPAAHSTAPTSAEPPTAAPPAGPPAKKQWVAPVPASRRPGGARSERKPGAG